MSITGAPRIGNGIVFIGQGGAEFHQRGFMSAYDAETGKQLWQFWTVPGNPAKGPTAASDSVMAMAAKTWNGRMVEDRRRRHALGRHRLRPADRLGDLRHRQRRALACRKCARRAAATTCSPRPSSRWMRRPASTSGTTRPCPMDSFDFDNTSPLTTADLVIDGQKKHVVMQVPEERRLLRDRSGHRQGDQRATGRAACQLAHGLRQGEQLGAHPQSGCQLSARPARAGTWCRSRRMSGHPQSYNPNTGLIYVGIRYATYGMVSEAGAKMGNQLLSINVAKRPEAAAPKLEGAGGWLMAWDPVTQKESLAIAMEGTARPGTMTTAGNLVFQGTAPRNLTAFRADTGEKVWSTDTGVNISAGSISYAVGGTQYVAAVVGGRKRRQHLRLVVYKLGGTVTLPRLQRQRRRRPSIRRPTSATAAQLAQGSGSSTRRTAPSATKVGAAWAAFPDLRTTPMMQNAALFKAIVIDGALTDNGMMSFHKVLSPEDVEAIRSHVVTLGQ